MKMNTDKAYLLGLFIGGADIRNKTLTISFPYEKWGDLKDNPNRAGEISQDILLRLQPMFKSIYKMDISYKVSKGGKKWLVMSNQISNDLIADLTALNLPKSGEFRKNAEIEVLYNKLNNKEQKKQFVIGLADTVGSLNKNHRRFVSDFQIVSFEFSGNKFNLIKFIAQIFIDLNCLPDQILWNHPNQHSGTDRYYRQWKKGFKIRVALDDYMLDDGFIFKSKQLSAEDNKKIQHSQNNSSQGKANKVSGRTTVHIDENSDFLPMEIRGYHFIHNLHFYSALGLKLPDDKFNLDNYIQNFEKYFCPFTCLTKDSFENIQKIINNESYLKATKYKASRLNLKHLYEMYLLDPSRLIYGKSKHDGFPISEILKGVAYIICATKKSNIRGKRVLGSYLDVVKENLSFDITLELPDKGTCVQIHTENYGALVGYVNDDFNKKLIVSKDNYKVRLRSPTYKECITL